MWNLPDFFMLTVCWQLTRRLVTAGIRKLSFLNLGIHLIYYLVFFGNVNDSTLCEDCICLSETYCQQLKCLLDFCQFWYRSYLQRVVKQAWLLWKSAQLRSYITYFTFHIYCPVWVKFLARHLHIMLSSFCELRAVQLRVGHVLLRVSVKLHGHRYIENVWLFEIKEGLGKVWVLSH